jgi:UDP-N-acetylglucosamine--N-acetylmuramyl-(pentapeptide) pyrophosphoryl-undecaprenol N-acetylglucosamine transferase
VTVVLLAGGGTAGHVTPALATAEALRDHDPALVVEFVGTATGLEAGMVPAAGWKLHHVEAAPLLRRLSPQTARLPFVVLRSARLLTRLIRRRSVAAACVFGGYVCGPLALAARWTGVPLLIHEQNAAPGLANRIAARWAWTVAVSVPGTQRHFPRSARTVVTGNPVRADLLRADLAALRPGAMAALGLRCDRPTVLAFGGSLGARRLNDALLQARWPDPAGVQLLHVAGARDHARVAAAWASADPALAVRCEAFLDDMAPAYAAADVVVCRAGASTIAELTVLGLPSVLVPYPHAAADEQTANARALVDAGAATMITDADLDGARLVAAVAPLLADDARRAAVATAARSLGRPDAAARLAELLVAAAGSRPSAAGGP